MNSKFKSVFIILTYIFLNIIFYSISTKNYSNLNIFLFTTLFGLVELILFINFQKYLTNFPKLIWINFIVTILLINIGRTLLLSSPTFNDYVNYNFIISAFIGIPRIYLIFLCIVLSFYFYENRIFPLFFSSLIGIIVGILLYLEFDANITSILRIVISLLMILFIYKQPNKNITLSNDSNISLEEGEGNDKQ